ncbi:unnamed protein product [Withania somnifera]
MSETGRCGGRGAGNSIRETHIDSNEGSGQDQEYGGHGQGNNNNGNRGRVPPRRGRVMERIIEDVWGTLSSPRTAPPSTQSN